VLRGTTSVQIYEFLINSISRKFYFQRKAKKEHRVNLNAIQEAIKKKGD